MQDYRKIKIKRETDCSQCVHYLVCRFDLPSFCKNYQFGNSRFWVESCATCINTKSGVPCFRCEYFEKRKRK